MEETYSLYELVKPKLSDKSKKIVETTIIRKEIEKKKGK